MGLISTEVEVNLVTSRIPYYENLGYKIPRVKDKSGILRVPKGTKLLVDVNDLSRGSNIKVIVECDDCKKQYPLQYKQYYDTLHDGFHRCRSCYLKWQSGENHYKWNSDITDEERERKRNIPGYTDFVKIVMTRDDYTCQCCGEKSSRDLVVHHLDGYCWCIDKRIDPNNGITLCGKCHKNFHMKYGTNHSTKNQFEEWIGQKINLFINPNLKIITTRQIYCLEDDAVYDSSFELAEKWGLGYTSTIYDACNFYRRILGLLPDRKNNKIHSVLNKHLLWYDDYLKMSEDDIVFYLNKCNEIDSNKYKFNKPVMCVTTNKKFSSIKEAGRYYNISPHCISRNVRGIASRAGKLPDGTQLRWMYYDDYLKTLENEQEELSDENIA